MQLGNSGSCNEVRTDTNIVDLGGVKLGLLQRRLTKRVSIGPTDASNGSMYLEHCTEKLINAGVLQLALLRASQNTPFRERNDDVVCSLLQQLARGCRMRVPARSQSARARKSSKHRGCGKE